MMEKLASISARLERTAAPQEVHDLLDDLNPHSKEVITACLEPSLRDAQPEERFQFERHGYFVAPDRAGPS